MEKKQQYSRPRPQSFPPMDQPRLVQCPREMLKKHKMKYFKGHIISTCGFPLVASECLHFFHHSNVKQL